jgi:hypothetical protein
VNAGVNAVIQAYRFALDPTSGQDAVLRSHCGGQRYAFNWGLALVKANVEQRWAEKTYGIPAAELTPSLSWSAYSLRKLWNRAKDTTAPWWAENSKEAYSSGLANLATALGNWNASKTGKRRGPKVRFPRIKGKRKTLSCRFSTGALGLVERDRRHVKLPRIGTIRTLDGYPNRADTHPLTVQATGLADRLRAVLAVVVLAGAAFFVTADFLAAAFTAVVLAAAALAAAMGAAGFGAVFTVALTAGLVAAARVARAFVAVAFGVIVFAAALFTAARFGAAFAFTGFFAAVLRTVAFFAAFGSWIARIARLRPPVRRPCCR